MGSFLEQLAEQIIQDYRDEIGQLTVVFPNRRAGIFFKEVLARKVNRAVWSPQVLTFEELAGRLSSLVLADKLTLIYRLYEVFRDHTPTQESFDQFYFWGDILLQDFSEVDMALVQAEDLFTNLTDLKALEAGYDYLTEEQKQTIARFWKSFEASAHAAENSANSQQQFKALGNVLAGVSAFW